MNTIDTPAELRENLLTLERYMESDNMDERDFHRGLVKRGICFVVYQKDKRYLFAPSRFVGYQHNSMNAHNRNDSKDGKVTNPAISKILGQCTPDNALENLYRNFCHELGFMADHRGNFGIQRKFWRL